MPRASSGPAPAYLTDNITAEFADKLNAAIHVLNHIQTSGAYATDVVELFLKFRGVFEQERARTGARKPNFATLETLKRAALALAGAPCENTQDFTLKVLVFNALSLWLAACLMSHRDPALSIWYAETQSNFAGHLAADALDFDMTPATPPAWVAL